MSEHVDVSIVIPTFRGQGSLVPLIEGLDAALSERDQVFEYVVVDDRSPDDTWEVLCDLSRRNDRVRALRLQQNVGQMSATLCGLAHAAGDVIVTMDDDLQHPPDQVPVLLDALTSAPDVDVVIGSWRRGNDGLFRALGSKVFGVLQTRAMPESRGLRHTGFRALRRSVADAMVAHETRLPVVPSLISEVAGRVVNVEVDHAQRPFGRSGFRLRSAVRLTLDMLLQSTAAPLKWIAGFGFFVSAVALIIGAVYLVRAFAGVDTPPGWASSFLAIVFFGGATLGTLGLIGRYLAIVMTEVRRPPRWVVREEVGREG